MARRSFAVDSGNSPAGVSPPDRPELPLGELMNWATDALDAADLAYGHGTDNPGDEAAFIVLEGLGLPIEGPADGMDQIVGRDGIARIVGLVQQRIATRQPAAYLLGRAYIAGHRFAIDERALVPRSFIGEFLAAGIGATGPLPYLERVPATILELGTGSGCLAILAALAFPDARIDAVDISADALDLARRNVADYQLTDRITLLRGDLYAPVAGKRYDLIISNPPYVDAEAMAALPEEYRNEPALGLAGGDDGLDIVRRIVDEASAHLSGGGLLCEIGTGAERLTAAYPETMFLWLDSETSNGEVFWLDARDCPERT